MIHNGVYDQYNVWECLGKFRGNKKAERKIEKISFVELGENWGWNLKM